MAPSARTTRGNRGTRGTSGSPSNVPLRDKLVEMFTVLEMPFAVAGDEHCSGIIQARAPLLAAALEDAARENPVLKAWLERAVQGGSILSVAVIGASIMVPILQHHGLMPGSDPFAWFLPTSPADAAQRQAMADQMQAFAAEAAARQAAGAEAAKEPGESDS